MEVSIKNFNQQLRENIVETINALMMNGMDLKSACNVYSMYVLSLGESSTKENYIMQSYILSLGYLDAYKIYSYRQKESLNNIDEEAFYGQLFDVYEYEDIILMIRENPAIISKLIESIHEFSEANELRKIAMVKSLSVSENEALEEGFQIHNFDRLSYDVGIDLNMLINNYKKIINKQEENLYSFEIAAQLSLANFIRKFIIFDKNQTCKVLSEIATIDYEVSNYMFDKVENESLKEIMIEHVAFYDKSSAEDIISRLIADETFLHDALMCVIDLEIFKSCDDISLEENLQTEKSKVLELKLKKDVDK